MILIINKFQEIHATFEINKHGDEADDDNYNNNWDKIVSNRQKAKHLVSI